jgi:uncharacterized protein (TIGR04141 family)
LKELCKLLLETSRSTHYRTDYPWIDNMAIIADPVMIESLYADLIAAIKGSKFDNMFIAAPEFIDNLYEYDGFVFTGDRKRRKNKEAHSFPTMTDLARDLGEEFIAGLDYAALSKSWRVCLRDTEGNAPFGWPLSRCIVWETEKDGCKYVLSEGDWYKIDTKFYQDVRKFFDDHVHDIGLPALSSGSIRESEYNAAVCASVKGMYLFDLGHKTAKLKYITKDKNEICDIFDAPKKRFIHVKVGKSSSDISHLLRQGVFSGQALKLDSEALEAFRGHLKKDGCAEGTISMPYNPNDYEIVFAVILDEKQDKDIPFFSKVSFWDAARQTLEMMGYTCRFGFIALAKT